MANTVLVYAERRDGTLRRVAFEALGAARRLAGEDGAVHAVLAGSGIAAEDAAALQARGAGEARTRQVGLFPPPPRSAGKRVAGNPAEQAAELVRLLRSEAKVLQ